MNTKQAYNIWAAEYDTKDNKTRDIEALALKLSLASIPFNKVLEIGCGTGKNTEWLIEKAALITAVDFSEQMLARAKDKINSNRVQFKQADITSRWNFRDGLYDLVTFSLVLEHIDNLDYVFNEVSKSLNPNGYVYIGELHPFKQYYGIKARFETEEGRQVIDSFNHNVSDFIHAGKKHGLSLVYLDEYFDDNDRSQIPRILTILLKKS
ncbi:class I SAM-dependent methyltransferase [Pedobacter psychroterrae]|uniref:Class I SAM-dependent methyltransferase n=1 Tax=Pedobacter psychroterrae TaxID=2530453 RepID=A0A4R0NKY1_9SPHI|nr:class I SAM-dependent methyltransferase [Pedobacter psychroterrae]TCD00839.1 class I SAM-dependent methyltransferase [Pedobacter psychroterrae]